MPPQSSPIVSPTPKTFSAEPGSLWVEAGEKRWSLIRDDKALEVGDIVMVEVMANTVAEEAAKTETKRTSDIEASISNLFGQESKIPSSLTPVGGSVPPLVKSKSNAQYSGDGLTKRSGKITARVSCLVTQAYANGNMRIYGSEGLTINNERTILTVEGIIRPSDVTWDNKVLSTQIADARIEFTGRGVVSDIQRPGILMRGFACLWPF